jgi:hypothetical protein
MSDDSHLDDKYFIDPSIYNCPFCNRRHVTYLNLGSSIFDWSNTKKCSVWRVKCQSCLKVSMHLTFKQIADPSSVQRFRDIDLDSAFFYSAPTSFFAIDARIPANIRELITEAQGCRKMNHLVGASACTRKAIYELLAAQGATGANYDEKITAVREKFSTIDSELFEILGHVKDMTSDHVHEQSWVTWDSQHLELFLQTLQSVLHEIYVVPDEKKNRVLGVRGLKEKLATAKNAAPQSAEPSAAQEHPIQSPGGV